MSTPIWVQCPACRKTITLSVQDTSGRYADAPPTTEEDAEARLLAAAAMREHLKVHARPAEPTS